MERLQRSCSRPQQILAVSADSMAVLLFPPSIWPPQASLLNGVSAWFSGVFLPSHGFSVSATDICFLVFARYMLNKLIHLKLDGTRQLVN